MSPAKQRLAWATILRYEAQKIRNANPGGPWEMWGLAAWRPALTAQIPRLADFHWWDLPPMAILIAWDIARKAYSHCCWPVRRFWLRSIRMGNCARSLFSNSKVSSAR